MARWGMVIDLDKCTACQACVVACRMENNVSFAGDQQAAIGRAIEWMEVVANTEGEYPRVRQRFTPMPCMHCDNPPCVKVCPVGATYRNPDGLIGQIYALCIGCRLCTVACPYTRRYFNWYAPEFPETLQNYLNPAVPVRSKGVAEKCSFCVQRIREGEARARAEGRELHDGEVNTACAQACPAEAIYFGDLDDHESLVARLAESPRAFRLQEDLGTRPKVIYLSGREWDAKA